MHVVNQWRSSGKALLAETAKCLSCIDWQRLKSMWICTKMSKPVMGSLVPQSIKKKRAKSGKFEERKLRKMSLGPFALKGDAKGRLRKKGVGGFGHNLMSPWHLLTCPWHHYRSQGGDHAEQGLVQVLITGSDGFTDQKMKLFIQWRCLGEADSSPLPENQR